MYNVRFIEYPTGIQVRIYSDLFFRSDEDEYDCDSGNDECEKDVGISRSEYEQLSLDLDVFESANFEWEDIDGIDIEKISGFKSEESKRVSMSRTKSQIYHIARSNIWEWFVTLTLDKNKIDRYDFDLISKKVRKWFDNLRQRKAPGLYYLIVPERHKNGAWHFHALIGGCAGLSFVESGRLDKEGNTIYNFENWKFGFSTASKVRDTSRVSSYIAKYITKTLCDVTRGLQRYWASKNCKRAVIEEYFLTAEELDEYKKYLYENMTWKKRLESVYGTVEYYELPAEQESVD